MPYTNEQALSDEVDQLVAAAKLIGTALAQLDIILATTPLDNGPASIAKSEYRKAMRDLVPVIKSL
jgi:hypothetical protein